MLATFILQTECAVEINLSYSITQDVLLIQRKLSIHLPVWQHQSVVQECADIFKGEGSVGINQSLGRNPIPHDEDNQQGEESQDLWQLQLENNMLTICSMMNKWWIITMYRSITSLGPSLAFAWNSLILRMYSKKPLTQNMIREYSNV